MKSIFYLPELNCGRPAGHSGSVQHPQTRDAGLRQQGQVGLMEISGLDIAGMLQRPLVVDINETFRVCLSVLICDRANDC